MRRKALRLHTSRSCSHVAQPTSVLPTGLVGSATTVCLQINRFPALGIRSKTMISWNRQHVMMPCCMHASGRTVHWLEYRLLHAPRPSADRRPLSMPPPHWGGRFLCDDDRVPISVPHLKAMDEDIYLVWLMRTATLTAAYRTMVTRPNPFVPLFSHT